MTRRASADAAERSADERAVPDRMQGDVRHSLRHCARGKAQSMTVVIAEMPS
ncbi:MAG: hypothetical protein OXH41_13225 [Chloroflexi bacterium]|nr:hypothetical protein [Chloroflexota bacterium]